MKNGTAKSRKDAKRGTPKGEGFILDRCGRPLSRRSIWIPSLRSLASTKRGVTVSCPRRSASRISDGSDARTPRPTDSRYFPHRACLLNPALHHRGLNRCHRLATAYFRTKARPVIVLWARYHPSPYWIELKVATTCDQIDRGLKRDSIYTACHTVYPRVSQVHSHTGAADPRHALAIKQGY
jgi:hypothetical protein